MTKRIYNPLIVSERLKTLRKEKGLTQQEVADIVGLSLTSIKQYEGAKRIPDTHALNVLSGFFRVDNDYILGAAEFQTEIHRLQSEIGEATLKSISHETIALEYFEDLFDLKMSDCDPDGFMILIQNITNYITDQVIQFKQTSAYHPRKVTVQKRERRKENDYGKT